MLCANQGAGKSHLIKYLVYMNRHAFDIPLIFSNTGFIDSNFDYIDHRLVHLEYDPYILEEYKRIFREHIEARTKNPSLKQLTGLVIFDDCITGPQWNDPELKSLITQVRHFNVVVILSTQYPKAVPPIFRSNTWGSFMFYMPTESSIKGLYENYGQMFENYKSWKTWYLTATTPKYHFVYCDVMCDSRDLNDRYKVMICPPKIPDFKLSTKYLPEISPS